MTSLYEVLKAQKMGAAIAPDYFTALWAGATGGGEQWETIEYTGAVPVEINAAGEPLIDLIISGNMNQSGTPSPTTPIQPQECGERTAQLFDIASEKTISDRIAYDCTLTIGQRYTFTNCSDHVLGFKISNTATSYNSVVKTTIQPNESYTFTMARNPNISEGSTQYFFIILDSVFGDEVNEGDVMLNSGSSALPFEPYGYKIPISSANTTTPVYLGEVETTRQVKKLVLDGTENWELSSMDSNRTVCRLSLNSTNVVGYCSHIKWKSTYEAQDYNRIVINNYLGGSLYVSLENSILSGQTVDDFKSYLAQQYANGTPVCVWYVLATPTTGILNEPLRKIGNYADSLSVSQTIPTVEGANVVDVLTALKPSEVYIKYKGRSN